MQSVIKEVLPAVVFLGVGVLTVASNQRLLTEPKAKIKKTEMAEPYSPKLFQALSFGHIATQVDSIWIQAISGEEKKAPLEGLYSDFYYLLDLLTDLDPYFMEAYEAGGHLLVIARKEKEGTEKFLQKGIRVRRSLPDVYKPYWIRGWALSVLLAYTRLFEFKDLPGASEYFKDAAQYPEAPAYLQRLKKRLEAPGGLYEVGFKLIDFMLLQVQSEERKMELEKKKIDLRVSHYLFQANLAYSSFRELRGKGEAVEKTWSRYLKNAPKTDPWGGVLSLNEEGKIESSTPHEKVFGLY